MSSYKRRPTPGDTEWFVADRFGMFIHFGLYSLASRHEWVMSYEKISPEEYKKYFDRFDPDLFDAKEWARKAKAAGIMTTSIMAVVATVKISVLRKYCPRGTAVKASA